MFFEARCLERLVLSVCPAVSVMFATLLKRVVGPFRWSGAARNLCTDATKNLVEQFLKAASRPKFGKAKAKQSAGQKPVDLTKQASRLGELDFAALLRTKGAALKEMGIPVQERKRMLNFLDKYRQGFRHDGRTGKHSWKGWRAPKSEAMSVSN